MKRFQARVKNVRSYSFRDFYRKFDLSRLKAPGASIFASSEPKPMKTERTSKNAYDRGFNHSNWSS